MKIMKLTKNFWLKEFECKDGTPVPKAYYTNVQELANNLQILRNYLGVAVEITGSGYRTPSHNTKVNGAKNSQHLTASAADINAKGYTPKELGTTIEKLIKEGKMKQGGLGIYTYFVHYDIRGTKARW
jgi:uncharacterized protein YcbK (DUF882 family)